MMAKAEYACIALFLATVMLLGGLTSNANAAWYWKPSFPNYAPNGVPDFDQKQDGWRSIFCGTSGAVQTTADAGDVQVMAVGASCSQGDLVVSMGSDGVLTTTPAGSDYFEYDYCGPTAVANSFWWFDSEFNPSPLVGSYGAWGDHDPQNAQPLISDLAHAMDTDSQRTLGMGTHGWFSGTYTVDMENAIDTWLTAKGLAASFHRKGIDRPTFAQVVQEVTAGEDVILQMGYWGYGPAGWLRFGGHYVTVAGVDSQNSLIAFSDPYYDVAAPGLPSHNDAQYVSHDMYTAGPTPSPGGTWGPQGYGTGAAATLFFGQNPSPLIVKEPNLQAHLSDLPKIQQEITTEVEYAIVVSPVPHVIPEYPLGLPILAIFMLVSYGLIRRRTSAKKL
jgi:hypothetical protein